MFLNFGGGGHVIVLGDEMRSDRENEHDWLIWTNHSAVLIPVNFTIINHGGVIDAGTEIIVYNRTSTI
jgi:hypothetical protein